MFGLHLMEEEEKLLKDFWNTDLHIAIYRQKRIVVFSGENIENGKREVWEYIRGKEDEGFEVLGKCFLKDVLPKYKHKRNQKRREVNE